MVDGPNAAFKYPSAKSEWGGSSAFGQVLLVDSDEKITINILINNVKVSFGDTWLHGAELYAAAVRRHKLNETGLWTWYCVIVQVLHCVHFISHIFFT